MLHRSHIEPCRALEEGLIKPFYNLCRTLIEAVSNPYTLNPKPKTPKPCNPERETKGPWQSSKERLRAGLRRPWRIMGLSTVP